MNQQSLNIKAIREIARDFDFDTIESCMQLAIMNKENPCYSKDETEEAVNILAKASFVRGQMNKGLSLSESVRELGKRIRAVQVN